MYLLSIQGYLTNDITRDEMYLIKLSIVFFFTVAPLYNFPFINYSIVNYFEVNQSPVLNTNFDVAMQFRATICECSVADRCIEQT